MFCAENTSEKINYLYRNVTDYFYFQIAPLELGVSKEALMESDLTNRAEIMLQQVKTYG
jgi:hypothetical protein